MLSDIVARFPVDQVDVRVKLMTARNMVRDMENLVRGFSGSTVPELEQLQWNQNLNEIQSVLEELASSAGFGDSEGEAR